jgi:5,10-methylene-tetrahydrofolate dehydrogenase/methenyl tetrahydrofolate cyclohydrolase
MYYVSYFRTVDWRTDAPHRLTNDYITCFDTHAISSPERNESVLMVPGSVSQMTADMLAQDAADAERQARYDAYWMNT